VSGFVFGAIMNLWVWPFLAEESALDWNPAASAGTNLHHYLTYYAATSFAWDTFRAVGSAALVLALARRLLGSLDRAARRMRLHVDRPLEEVRRADPVTASALVGGDPLRPGSAVRR
jgi:hypothetical protein